MNIKKSYLLIIIFLLLIVFGLTGCSKIEKLDPETGTKEVSSESKEDSKVAIKLNSAEEFNEEYGYAVISETIEFETTKYVIDKNFKVVHSFKQGSYATDTDYIDGYRIRKNADNSFSVLDIYGNDALTYGEHEYENVQLLSNGLILLVKKTDTYNSSESLGGVYDLKEGKYVLEPSKEYITFYEKGDNMYSIDGLDDTYFNTKTKKVVPFNRYTVLNFSDGFGVDDSYESSDDSYYVDVWDDNGGFKRIKGVKLHGNSSKTFANGILFNSLLIVDYDENHNHVISNHSHICNLSTGEVVDLGREEYYMPTNNVTFTSDGYALITFNNQGGTPYYTIIDTKGNKQFEPVKVNDNSAFSPDDNGEKRIIRQTELYEGNYIIAEDEGKNVVLDVKNNIILKAEEHESFLGITNNAVKVIRKEPGHYEEHYYKDLDGNKIYIYK